MIFKQTFKIGLSDVGKNNGITNRAIIKILENIGAYHSDIAGYGVLDIATTHGSWVVLEWKIKILQRPKYGQDLNVTTWAKLGGRAYTYRDYIVYDNDGNEMIKATSKWALLNIDTGRPIRIDNSVTDGYMPETISAFETNDIEKIEIPNTFSNAITYNVKRADIDINKHMHNLYYLDLAYETLPEEIFYNNVFDNIRITYKKEIKYGETVTCKYSNINNNHIVVVFNQDQTVIHAVISLE